MRYILLSFILIQTAQASNESICGEDNRSSTKDLRIGRLTHNLQTACTVTMIGKECAISAGHCMYFMSEGKVEFDVPMSVASTLGSSDPKNVYKIDAESIDYVDGGYGRDWSVFKILPNGITRSLPGEVNGFYPVNRAKMLVGEKIMISGYGIDQRENVKTHGTLQVASGEIVEIEEFNGGGSSAITVSHNVDTTPGDSGAAIIRVKEQDIIGVHSHGGFCSEIDGNKGTLISETKKFREAISNCLNPERTE